MHSCFYAGHVRHQRLAPVKHRFAYPLFLAYLDLQELPAAIRVCRLLQRRFGPACFCRADHLGPAHEPLDQSVRDLVARRTGDRPAGAIRLLTMLRSWGHYFSPLNLYYCFDEDGVGLHSVVAEVSNTPWLERHYYVLRDENRAPGTAISFRHAKSFHVSPFMDMDSQYEWRLGLPSDTLDLRLTSHNPKHPFHADLRLSRRPFATGSLLRLVCRHPWMSGQVKTRIYFQALQLWIKKCPFYPHPKHRHRADPTAAANGQEEPPSLPPLPANEVVD